MKIMKNLTILFLLLVASIFPQNKGSENILEKLLNENRDKFAQVIDSTERYRIQILYTQIDRDENNFPHFTSYPYHLNADKYFYPASTVKLAASVLSLEKLNNFNVEGLDKYTSLRIESAREGQTSVEYDSSSENNLPSIANYIKKIFLISDNNSFNRLYEFLGQRYFNKQLWSKRYCDIKILHRLTGGFSKVDNRFTNPFTFYKDDKVIFHQQEQYNPDQYKIDVDDVLQGKGYIADDSLITQPKDFSYSNYFALQTQQNILKAIIFPEAVPVEKRFNLTEDDYKFLYKYMSMFPRESKFKSFKNYEEYWDSYVKFLMFGNTKDTIPSNIRIFNKIGLAYGYLTDNAYIIDLKNNVEFMLSAVIYVNEDQIFNDDKYEYDKIGFPFLAELGNAVYNYELKRIRKIKPDLAKFKIDY